MRIRTADDPALRSLPAGATNNSASDNGDRSSGLNGAATAVAMGGSNSARHGWQMVRMSTLLTLMVTDTLGRIGSSSTFSSLTRLSLGR